MKKEVNGIDRIICDCCGRQIVEKNYNNEYMTGPLNRTTLIGPNKHCCINCLPDYNNDMETEEGKIDGFGDRDNKERRWSAEYEE
jgi:hypothetical protein